MAAQCANCGQEWAVSFLETEVINAQQVQKLVRTVDHHYFRNPDYRSPMDTLHQQPYFEGHTERLMPVMGEERTVHDIYQCDTCGQQFFHERVES